MFGFINDVMSAGWESVGNLASGIGTGISTMASGFFPTPQRDTIESEITKSGNMSGYTYRPVTTDAPSLVESFNWASQDWVYSPYANQYAPVTKIQESKNLAESVSGVTSKIGDFLGDFLGQTKEVVTAVDEIYEIFNPRETITGTPRAGYPEGRDEQHLNTGGTSGADILEIAKAYGGKIIDQFKGLFNLGYGSPAGSQPAIGISHEIDPSSKTTMLIIMVIIAIIGGALILRKK